jgi:hypothetical protein
MNEHPPAWAQHVIALVVPASRRESVLGDLLEEYREAQVPEVGESSARAWYWRQALAFLWHASLNPGVALGGNLHGRTLLDALSPVADSAPRALITTLIAMAIFALWGFRIGRSSGRVGGAVLVAIAASVIGTAVALVVTLAAMGVAGLALAPDSRMWAVLREGLDVPLPVIAVIGVVLAAAGASIGRLFTGSSGSRASLRT